MSETVIALVIEKEVGIGIVVSETVIVSGESEIVRKVCWCRCYVCVRY